MIFPVLLLSVGLSSQLASAACSRATLQEATTAYIKAQGSGQPNLLPLAGNTSYLENDVVTDIQKGVLAHPIIIDANLSLLDTTQCATFTELTAATDPHPYVIHTRMLFGDDGKITAVQSVIADAGDWVFNATATLYWHLQEKWDPIPAADRDSRAVLQAAGDAYLDSWSNGSVKVPYGTPCARIEGGLYTGTRSPTTNTCTMPVFPVAFTIKNRRYIIDEELGGLDIFNEFPFIDTTRPDGTPSTNLFRIEKGMIRYIHEVTVCATTNCGR